MNEHEIAGYEVLSSLGHGARSSIFAVKDQDGNAFALKRVNRGGDKDDRFLEQAILEHEIAVKLNHPVLRKSYEIQKLRRFFRLHEIIVIMELVDGRTLEQNRPRDILQICRIAQQVAQGLHAMHEAGFVHCDMKPNNVLVDDEGKVKVIDYGQSCPMGAVKPRIQGTPDYIAPEQVRREQLNAQTDVFNFGATMYWLMTLQHVPTLIPKAGTVNPKMPKCPSVRDINPACPPALATLIADCVEEKRSVRPPSMLRVIERLDYSISQMTREKSDKEKQLDRAG